MIFTKFHENGLIIDGEIKEKHALPFSCGPGYSKCLFMTLLYNMYKPINFIPVYSHNCVKCQMV